MFTDIIAATDLVHTIDPVVLAAGKMAKQFNATLHILHVLESSRLENRKKVRHYRTGEEIDVSQAYERMIEDEIHGLYSGIFESSINGDIRIITGFPWEEILRWSRQLKAGLIVMGPHSGRAEEKGVIRVAGKIGSTADAVIQRENCPVMIINPNIVITQDQFKNIVVGVDFSMSCECALALAAKLANHFAARIYPFHMIPVPPYPKYSRDNYTTDLEAAQKRLADFCNPIVKDIPHECFVWGGVLAHQEILACAEKKHADIIVLGSHTREQSGKWYSGSVVERTSFRAACPVMVVSDPASVLPWDITDIPEDAVGEKKDRIIHIFTKSQRP